MQTIPIIVSTEWLSSRLDDPKLRLIDVTTLMKPIENGSITLSSGKESYEQEHIPGAVYADLINELSDPASDFPFTVPDRDYFLEKISELGIGDQDTYTVIYDRGAVVGAPFFAPYWASRLRWQLKFEGLDNIAVLDGGLPKWIEEGRPITTEQTSYPKASFISYRRNHLLVTMDEVLKSIDDDSVILINSLSPEDFRGETNSYPRKGHIPGSANVFFGCHTDSTTKNILSDEELKENFADIGVFDSNKKVITYCGGGIAATWNALILEKLGVQNVAVYDGSMNEWASKPDLPLVTGTK